MKVRIIGGVPDLIDSCIKGVILDWIVLPVLNISFLTSLSLQH